MNLRGKIARTAAAVAATVLLVGGLGSPARAEEGDGEFPGAVLNIAEGGIWAATAPAKGCAGIGDGDAVPTADGWLYSKPAGEYKDLQYVLFYFTGTYDNPTDIFPILLNKDGVFIVTIDEEGNPEDLAKALAAETGPKIKAAGATAIELPHGPAPAGVTGKLVDDGGWVRTPKGWGLGIGFAVSHPLSEGTFNLVRACAAAAAPTSGPASPRPSTSAGPSLPVTGTDVSLITGAGIALVALGAVLFVAYRRRRNVKFVA